MSVIFRSDGLEARFAFLISGSASATRPRAPPATSANEDLRMPRRLKRGVFDSDISVDSFSGEILWSHLTPAFSAVARPLNARLDARGWSVEEFVAVAAGRSQIHESVPGVIHDEIRIFAQK